MLAKIDAVEKDEGGSVTVTLPNGGVLSADFGDDVVLTENTVGLKSPLAEHVAATAWAVAVGENADSRPWRRLVDKAKETMKVADAEHLRLN